MIVPTGFVFNNFLIVALVVTTLYFTREILAPIALAVLLSFVLAPLVRFLQRWRLPKAVAVISAVIVALVIATGLAVMVMTEVSLLGNDLPRYEATLNKRVQDVRDTFGGAGLIKNASNLLKDLNRQLDRADDAQPKADRTPSAAENNSKPPIPVEVHQPDPGASETLVAMLKPLISPFMTTGIVVIFLTFFLFQREDLRNRFIRLAGSSDLERTTTALDDAGRRLGQLFVTQLILNSAFGVIIGFGLALIGVPSSPLLGFLAMIFRFVPYIGAVMAAALPLVLSLAVGSDWSMALWTVALFAVVEPLTGQVIEPLVCGRTAGLSPVAVVLSASFWTWLWGPLGLLLSTPITLCLVVLARHVERLQFIDIMLGDQPALTPEQAAYQRMLTGDPVEAIEQARRFLKKTDGATITGYYEQILLGALRLAQSDAEIGRLDDSRFDNILATVKEVIEDLDSHGASKLDPSSKPDASAAEGRVVSLSGRERSKTVLCVPGLGKLDHAASLIVADVLRREGINSRAGTAIAVEDGKAASICVCCLEDISEGRRAYTVRKLSRKAPGTRIVVSLLGSTKTPDKIETERNEILACSLEETAQALAAA